MSELVVIISLESSYDDAVRTNSICEVSAMLNHGKQTEEQPSKSNQDLCFDAAYWIKDTVPYFKFANMTIEGEMMDKILLECAWGEFHHFKLTGGKIKYAGSSGRKSDDCEIESLCAKTAEQASTALNL